MRGQKRRDAPAITSDEDGGTRVDLLAQAEASVLPRDLDAECAERGETFDDVVRDFAIAIDLIGDRHALSRTLRASSGTHGLERHGFSPLRNKDG